MLTINLGILRCEENLSAKHHDVFRVDPFPAAKDFHRSSSSSWVLFSFLSVSKLPERPRLVTDFSKSSPADSLDMRSHIELHFRYEADEHLYSGHIIIEFHNQHLWCFQESKNLFANYALISSRRLKMFQKRLLLMSCLRNGLFFFFRNGLLMFALLIHLLAH